MIKNAAEGVLRVIVGVAVLDRLAYGQSQTSWMVRILVVEAPAYLRVPARGGVDLGTVDLHEGPAVWFLKVASPRHVDREVHSEESARERQRAPPLTSTRLGGHPLGSLPGEVVCLGDRGIGLVAASGVEVLSLVEYLRGGV